MGFVGFFVCKVLGIKKEDAVWWLHPLFNSLKFSDLIILFYNWQNAVFLQ